MSQPTALYRHFSADGELLYVGISTDPMRRLGQHKASASWAGQIANITLAWFPTRMKAAAAERRAVKVEKPVHNTVRFALPRRKVTGGLRHGEVLTLLDHYNAYRGDTSTVAGCAAALNLTVPALRKMLWLPRGCVVALTSDDVFELLLRVCRGPAYAAGPYMVDCLVAKMPLARQKTLALARQERGEAWEREHTTLGRPRPPRKTQPAQVSA